MAKSAPTRGRRLTSQAVIIWSVFGNRKAPASCSVGPDSGRDAGTPTAPAEALPKGSPSAEFTWVLAMVGASTGGGNRREDVRGRSSGVPDMAADTTGDKTDRRDSGNK